MPITQDRMIALLNEYEDFRRAACDVISRVKVQLHNQYLSPEERAEMALSEITIAPLPSTETLRVERRYYQSHERKNNRQRLRAEKRRRQLGIPERDSIEYRASMSNAIEDAQAMAEMKESLRIAPIGPGDVLTDEWGQMLPPDEVRRKVAALKEASGHGGQDTTHADTPQASPSEPVITALTDDFGNTMSAEEIAAMNARGLISGDDIF